MSDDRNFFFAIQIIRATTVFTYYESNQPCHFLLQDALYLMMTTMTVIMGVDEGPIGKVTYSCT